MNINDAKQSTYSEISGLSQIEGGSVVQPVKDEFSFQRMANMRQIAIDMEYSMFQGSYQAPADASTAGKTRGLANAISTNAVAAGTTALTKALMQQLFRTMADAGAQFSNIILFCNSFQKQQISDIYGYAPESRNVGGVNILQIETDFGLMGVQWAPQMPTDSVFAVEMDIMATMYTPVGGQLFIDEPLAKDGASEKAQLYTQFGLDYGAEEWHGKITGLTTS